MNLVSINNKNIKPKQPDCVDLKVLYNYAPYVKSVYDYSLQFLLDEFNRISGKVGHLKSASLKDKKRSEEKLKEDDVETPENLLDIVRGTVHFPSIEDLLDFINFAQDFEFNKKDFYKMEDKTVKKFITDVPVINKNIRNSFSFDINDNIKNKYSFLKKSSELNPRNYMDFKFYICIPVPSIKNNLDGDTFMFAEILATIDSFISVYDKTHCLYEVKRSFQVSVDDDIEKDDFNRAMDALICDINVEAIEKYNASHAFGINILPYKNNKALRLKILNDLGSSISLTTALCHSRNNGGR